MSTRLNLSVLGHIYIYHIYNWLVLMRACLSQNVTLHYYSETKKDRKMNFSMMNLSRYGEYEFLEIMSLSIFVWGGWGVKYPPDTPLPHISSYNSGTKSDKKLIFSGSINAVARSSIFKNRNSYLCWLGGKGGSNTPPLPKSKFKLHTWTNRPKMIIFGI